MAFTKLQALNLGNTSAGLVDKVAFLDLDAFLLSRQADSIFDECRAPYEVRNPATARLPSLNPRLRPPRPLTPTCAGTEAVGMLRRDPYHNLETLHPGRKGTNTSPVWNSARSFARRKVRLRCALRPSASDESARKAIPARNR